MNTNQEPYHCLGGYQNVMSGQVQPGDLATFQNGLARMTAPADDLVGACVDELKKIEVNIYRKIPVAKPGGERTPVDEGSNPANPGLFMPTRAESRKQIPIATGVIDYFPDAIAAIAAVSFAGNQQHNPGSSLHWDRSKSGDEADALMRHFVQRGTNDTDGLRHSAKMAWRALALLQKELEASGHESR